MDRLTDRQTNYDLQNDIPMTHDNLVANPANTKLLQFTGEKKTCNPSKLRIVLFESQ